jgi:eukaryotic-like serine/threonine-protein kinase
MESLATSVVVGGRYRHDGVLGEGGMARVFEAFDLTLERPVAVKVLRPEADALPDVQRRFQQEARFAAQIHHPHVVAILDFGEDKGHSYLVMERLPGATLRNEMAAGPISPQRTLMVVSEMLTALRAAHRHGVLHRDIKPSNVLVQEDGHTKLTDFGIAKGFNMGRPLPTNPDETMTGVVLGTPGYLAPERAAGLPASVQSDLYSVGAVMVEALTGKRLSAGGAIPDGLPLRHVVGRAMAVDPRNRFESADAMLEALQPPANPAELPTRLIVAPPIAPDSTATNATVPAAAAPTAVAPTDRTAALTRTSGSVPRRRRKLWAALVLTTAAACALIASLFVLLEGGARTTGRGEPVPTAHRASTSTTITSTTFATTTTTLLTTTTTVPKHHGGSLLHQLHKEERDGILPSGGHGSGAGSGRGGQG